VSPPIAGRASSANPCPVCGTHTKGCSTTADGAFFCRGEAREGFKLVKPGEPFSTYRRADDTTNLRGGNHAAPHTNGKTTKPTDWPAEAERHAAQMTDAARAALARCLGLPVAALAGLDGIGYIPDDPLGEAWTFPERNGKGEVVGLTGSSLYTFVRTRPRTGAGPRPCRRQTRGRWAHRSRISLGVRTRRAQRSWSFWAGRVGAVAKRLEGCGSL